MVEYLYVPVVTNPTNVFSSNGGFSGLSIVGMALLAVLKKPLDKEA